MTPDEMRLHLMDKGATKPAIPKHERKANLDKFLQPSAEKGVMYHATMHDFNKFRTNHRGMQFVTPDISFANNYLHGQQDHDDPLDSGENIMPVHVQVKNPFDYAKLSHVKNLFRQAKKQKPTLSMSQRRGVLGGSWSILEHPDIVKAVKRLGHDAMYVSEESGEGDGLDSKNLGVFDPRKIKSAIGNRGTYDPKEDDITKADGGAINAEPLGEDTVKWTSPLADTVNSHKLGSMSGEQWMKWLHANAPRNAKKEAHASGTFDWLPQQANASKEAIVKHMKANAPQIKVKKFENNPKPRDKARFEELCNEGEVRRLTSSERDEIEELEQKLEDTPQTKFDEHVLPRGENYREMTLSHSNPTADDYIVPAGHGYQDNDADINRILHMRMNDMPFTYYPDKKALNLEELQSDWAQQGRSSGFKKPEASVTKLAGHKWDKGIQDTFGINEGAPAWGVHDAQGKRLGTHWDESAAHQLARTLNKTSKGLPSGPYVQNTEDWTRLGLHHAIKEAAEKGHHAVTWTNGDEQAKRWSNEGLKHYYDTVMPSVTNDILKKMGVKERVGKHFLGRPTTGINTHHGFHMTPEIVAHIKKHGLPRFASGGDISKLKAYMLKKQGTHGAQRVERAADEVPNLENMYDLRALRSAFDNKTGAVAVINPADFEKYSSPLSSSNIPPSEIDATVKYLRSVGKFSDVPNLNFHKHDLDEPIIPGYEEIIKRRRTPRIVGHNGRHRSQALTSNGEQSSLVTTSPAWDLHKHLKSKTHPEYLDALHKEMAKTDHMVRPETYEIDGADQHRPAIALPKMFATGGRSVEALDRESDEVPIEKRVRDALDKIHLNASGGKDTYGTGAGGRLAVDFPISKSLTLSPYLEGSAYKPNNQPTSSSISGAGLSLTKRFDRGGTTRGK